MGFDSLIIASLLLSGLLAATWASTKLMIRQAPRLGLVKAPTHRCAHTLPTPRGGGIAFVITSLLAILVCYGNEVVSGSLLTVLFCGGTLIAALGFCDDLYQLSIKKRMGAQLLVIAASLYVLLPFPIVEFAGIRLEADWLLWGLFTVAMVWWLNLFNFMDGIDGLAATEAICVLLSAVALMSFQPAAETNFVPALMLTLSAALLGFLIVNWAPAGIFMGDAGSTFLGYMLGMLAAVTTVAGTLNLWVWLILPGAFWVDATFTLLRRMFRGDRWYQAHQSHAYQRASRYLEEPEGHHYTRQQAHRRVTLTVLALNVCWLLPMASAALRWPAGGPLLVAIAWLPLVVIAVLYGAGQPGNIPVSHPPVIEVPAQPEAELSEADDAQERKRAA